MPDPTTGTPRIGLGANITLDDYGNGTLPGNGTGVPLVNVESLGIPAPELKMIESKVLEGGRTIKKVPGMFDAGQITVNWELVNNSEANSQYTRLEACRTSLNIANLTFNLKIVLGNGATGTLSVTGTKGYVVKNEIKPVTSDEKQMVETTISLTG